MKTLPLGAYARLTRALDRFRQITRTTSVRQAIGWLDDVWDACRVFVQADDFKDVSGWHQLQGEDAWRWLEKHRARLLATQRQWEAAHGEAESEIGPGLGKEAIYLQDEIDEFRQTVEAVIGEHRVFVPILPPRDLQDAEGLYQSVWGSTGVEPALFRYLPILTQQLFDSAVAAVAYGEGTLAATAALQATEAALRMFSRHYRHHEMGGSIKPREWGPLLSWCRDRGHLDGWTTKRLDRLRQEERNMAAHGRKVYSQGEAINTLIECARAVGGLLRQLDMDDRAEMQIELFWPPPYLDDVLAVFLLAQSPQENRNVELFPVREGEQPSGDAMFSFCGPGILARNGSDQMSSAAQVARLLQIEAVVQPLLNYVEMELNGSCHMVGSGQDYSLSSVCRGLSRKYERQGPTRDWLGEIRILMGDLEAEPGTSFDTVGQRAELAEFVELARAERKEREFEKVLGPG